MCFPTFWWYFFWQSRASNSLVSFLFYKLKLPGVFSVKSASQDSLEASLPECSQEFELDDVTKQSPGSLQQWIHHRHHHHHLWSWSDYDHDHHHLWLSSSHICHHYHCISHLMKMPPGDRRIKPGGLWRDACRRQLGKGSIFYWNFSVSKGPARLFMITYFLFLSWINLENQVVTAAHCFYDNSNNQVVTKTKMMMLMQTMQAKIKWDTMNSHEWWIDVLLPEP